MFLSAFSVQLNYFLLYVRGHGEGGQLSNGMVLCCPNPTEIGKYSVFESISFKY